MTFQQCIDQIIEPTFTEALIQHLAKGDDPLGTSITDTEPCRLELEGKRGEFVWGCYVAITENEDWGRINIFGWSVLDGRSVMTQAECHLERVYDSLTAQDIKATIRKLLDSIDSAYFQRMSRP